jgi:hypothetical protein
VNVEPTVGIAGVEAGDDELLLQPTIRELAARTVKNKKEAVRKFFMNYEKIKLLARIEINEVL